MNNASGPEFVPYDLDRWSDTIQTDLLGAMFAPRFAIDSMRRVGGGAVVNISSTSALGHGRKRAGGMPAYDAAKAGILRLTTSLAWLAEKERIRIKLPCPRLDRKARLAGLCRFAVTRTKAQSSCSQKADHAG